jgi:hypothetical protein
MNDASWTHCSDSYTNNLIQLDFTRIYVESFGLDTIQALLVHNQLELVILNKISSVCTQIQ